MSTKRQAETQLGPDNWDQEEPKEKEDGGGSYKMAPKEVLEKRVIRTAKRRSQATGDAAQKTLFSGFSGFNKTQKSSFDFLANLTNGSKLNNNGSTPKSDTISDFSGSLITKPTSSHSGGSLSSTSTTMTKSPLVQSTSGSTIFGGTGSSPPFTQSVFASSKPDSTVSDTLFKVQSSVNSSPFTMKPSANSDKSISQVSSTFFGVSSGNANNNSPFSSKPSNIPVTTALKMSVANSTPSTEINKQVNKELVKGDKDDIVYYSNLKGLNESVLAWIQKHVEATPLCILTPIFKDYEKHLKTIQEAHDKSKEQSSTKNNADFADNQKETKNPAPLTGYTVVSTPISKTPSNSVFPLTSSTTSLVIDQTSNFTFGTNTPTSSSANNNNFATNVTPSRGFSFGIKPSSASTSPLPITSISASTSPFAASKTSAGTSPFASNITAISPFAANTSTSSCTLFAATKTNTNISPFAATTSASTSLFAATASSTSTSPFAVTTTTSASTSLFVAPSMAKTNNSSTPFSFGIGKPFAFNSNIKKLDEPANEGDDNEDEPPKVEYTPIKEDNSLYDKKCKVFVKKDGNYVDKGVGTLYIKKIEETGKHQLLVRGNTSLGNVLINLILSSSLPTQRMGKNNVMMVCMPTPDAKPPPTSILIRVKTSEDADELLDTLNKYKA